MKLRDVFLGVNSTAFTNFMPEISRENLRFASFLNPDLIPAANLARESVEVLACSERVKTKRLSKGRSEP